MIYGTERTSRALDFEKLLYPLEKPVSYNYNEVLTREKEAANPGWDLVNRFSIVNVQYLPGAHQWSHLTIQKPFLGFRVFKEHKILNKLEHSTNLLVTDWCMELKRLPFHFNALNSSFHKKSDQTRFIGIYMHISKYACTRHASCNMSPWITDKRENNLGRCHCQEVHYLHFRIFFWYYHDAHVLLVYMIPIQF